MRRLAVLGTVAFVIVLLLVAQLVLPGIAAQRLRDRLARNGQVIKVEVDAFPAIELLWHNADKIVVKMGRYHSNTGHLSSLLDEASSVGTVDASASEVDAGLLTLHNASMTKRGNRLTGTATLAEADLRRAFPVLDGVQVASSSGGQITLRGVATVLGVTAAVDATVRVDNGALVVQPDVPILSLAAITVFRDSHLAVYGVAATPTAGGFTVSAQGHFR